jgi:hypothetical protein
MDYSIIKITNGYYFHAYANLQTLHYGLSLYLFYLYLLPLQRYPTLISDSSSTLYRLYVQLLRDRFLLGWGFYFTALLFAPLFSVMTFQFLDVIWLLGDFCRSFLFVIIVVNNIWIKIVEKAPLCRGAKYPTQPGCWSVLLIIVCDRWRCYTAVFGAPSLGDVIQMFVLHTVSRSS